MASLRARGSDKGWLRKAPPPDSFDRRLLVPMMLGSVLNPLNSSIIAVALVPIGAAFGAPVFQTQWLISALYLATAIGQPLVGRLVDMFGPKRLFLIGAALTGVAGVTGMLAPNLAILVVARVILGFGTCAGYPAAMSLIRSEGKRTGMLSPSGVLTALAVATQTISVIGPTLGGVLIGAGGWRSTLAINIPLAAACLILGALLLPSHTVLQTDRRGPSARVDGLGIVLFAATLTALLLFLMNINRANSWVLAVTGVLGTGFALWELRRPDPFIDLRVFAGNLPLIGTYARTLLYATGSYSFIYGFTQWLEESRGLTPAIAGLILLPAFGVGILVSTTTGRRPEVLAKLVVGAAAQVLACALVFTLAPASPIWLLLLIMVVLGLPSGLLSLGNQNALYHQADAEKIGASSGLMRTFMYLGAIAASSATGTFFGQRATTTGLHALAYFMLAAAAVLLLLTILDRSLRHVGAQPAV